jgi:uncharacterized phage protein (TIGR02218 family)
MPKTMTPALAAFLGAGSASADRNLGKKAELYTITLQSGSMAGIADGQTLTYTDFDADVSWNGALFSSRSVQIAGLRYKGSCGPDPDSTQITISAWPSDTIGGAPWLQAINQGLLDGAEIQRERAFFPLPIGAPPLTPVGTVIMFKGRVGKIDKIGRTQATLTVESDLTLLKKQMPLNFYSTYCVWVLYGMGCTLNSAAYTHSGAVEPGSTVSVINWSSAAPAYQQGWITFTSGVNEGITSTIKAAAAGALTLIYPLPDAPAAGDTFSATYGCDHTLATCGSRFGNTANYRAFPYIPPPQIVTGPLATTVTQGKG